MSAAWDRAAWDALAAELDSWQRTGRLATLWWRDDDAGPPHDALQRLLDLAARRAVPLALAVVPAWLGPETTDAVRGAAPGVVVVQHGFAHADHEPAAPPGAPKARPAEFGPRRLPAAALAEVADGRARLQAALGARCLPVFVPPWNRIAPAVTAGLPALGHRVLSAFGPRDTVAAAPGLRQVNCHADPIVWREGKRFVGARATLERLRAHLADRRLGRVDPAEPTGLLTHHRDMDPAFWEFLETLLDRLRMHPGVCWPPLSTLGAL